MRARSVSDNNIGFITPEYVLKDYAAIDDTIEDQLLQQYAYEEGLDVEELQDEDFENSDKFKEYYKYELLYWAERTIDMFNHEVIQADNVIPIWREMTVDDDWIDHLNADGKHLGIYWSWDEDAAEAHWGHGQRLKNASVGSIVDADHVNWKETIQLNMNPTLGQEEREIRLYKNTPLEVVSLEIAGEDVMDRLTQKIFLA